MISAHTKCTRAWVVACRPTCRHKLYWPTDIVARMRRDIKKSEALSNCLE